MRRFHHTLGFPSAYSLLMLVSIAMTVGGMFMLVKFGSASEPSFTFGMGIFVTASLLVTSLLYVMRANDRRDRRHIGRRHGA